jgi:hypothetical protein
VVCQNDLSPRNTVYRDNGDAATGDAAMRRLLAAGATEAVRRECAWVAANRAELAAALA